MKRPADRGKSADSLDLLWQDRQLTAAIIDVGDKKLVRKTAAEKCHLFQRKEEILEEPILLVHVGNFYKEWYAMVQLKSENWPTPSFL